jgi:hypothetical protein
MSDENEFYQSKDEGLQESLDEERRLLKSYNYSEVEQHNENVKQQSNENIMSNKNEWKSEKHLDYCIFIEHSIDDHKTFFEIEDAGETYIFNFYPHETAKSYWDDNRIERAHDPFTGSNVKGVHSGALIIDLGTHDFEYAKSITKDAIGMFDALFEIGDYEEWKDMYPHLEEQIKYQLQNYPPEPIQTKTPEQSPVSDRQLETAQKTGYVQGVCESILAFNNDENKKIMTEATMTFLSKKLLSEMNVTKDMAQKFANPETYKALEQSVFAPKQGQQLEQTQSHRRGI